eukprot:evm.model.scf_396.1 EVM.evm.TU.scf_396.1   scf_396:19352-26066(+)
MRRRKSGRGTAANAEEELGGGDGGREDPAAPSEATQPDAGPPIVDSDNSGEDASSDEESSSTEEDDGHVHPNLENKFLKTLVKIKKKDATIYNKDERLYSSEEGTSELEDEDGDQKFQRHKPMHLKDVRAQQLLEGGADAYSSSSEDLEDGMPGGNLLYNKEQEQNRREFLALAAVHENGDDDEQKASDVEEDFGGLRRTVVQGAEADDGRNEAETNELLDEIFGKGEELTEADTFLKDYLKGQKWIVPEDSVQQHDLEDIDEDEEYLEKADQFESTYNFRFEEPGANSIVNYPRVIDGSYRKTESKRKRQRERKKRRREEQAKGREEEVKHKKNLKIREIQNKVVEVRKAAGSRAPTEELLQDLLEDDFDMDDWDKKMLSAFGDEYYQEDEDCAEDLQRSGDESNGDQVEENCGAATVQEGDESEQDGNTEDDPGSKRAKLDVATASQARADLQHLLQDYYKLDYEDDIGGVKCRFKYKQVPSNSYGLAPEEILFLDDKQLNRLVGMKRINPYREDGGKFAPNPWLLKQTRREMDWSGLPERRPTLHGAKSRPQARAGKRGGRPERRVWQRNDGSKAHSDKQEAVKASHCEETQSLVDARLDSYAWVSVRKPGGKDGKSQKRAKRVEGAEKACGNDDSKRTEAQRRNARRARKRAALKVNKGGATG